MKVILIAEADEKPRADVAEKLEALGLQSIAVCSQAEANRWIKTRQEADPSAEVEASESGEAGGIERKRLEAILEARVRISEYAHGHTLDDLLTKTLDEAELLTGSTIGFFHFVEADQKTLSLQTWSTNTLKNMCTAAGKGQHYPVDKAGVWVEALQVRRPVIHNDYPSLPHRKGLPAGHAPVMREMVVPVLRNEQVVALLGVGNKPTPYGLTDTERVAQLANLVWDIVQAKRVTAALLESEERYRTLFARAHEGILILSLEAEMVAVNEAFARMHGYRVEEMRGMKLSDLDTPETALQIPERMSRIKSQGALTFEVKHYHKAGHIITIEVSASLVSLGGIPHIESFHRDITERKQREEQLHELTQRLTFHVEHSPLAVIEWGPDMRLIRWSGAAERIFGWKAEEVLGKRIEDLHWVYAEDEARVAEVSQDLKTGANRCQISFNRNYRKDGSVADCEWYNSSLMDATGQLRSIFSLVLDVTERKRAEAEQKKLELQNRQLQKHESLGRMAGAIAHHFNNKLAAVMMNLELIADDLPHNAQVFESLDAALVSAKMAADVSHSMLAYLGLTHSQLVPLDLSEACRKQVPMLQACLPGNVALEIGLAVPGPVVNGNINQIQQVLTNLVTNAGEAIGAEKGTLRLWVKTVAAGDIPPTSRFPIGDPLVAENYACLEVQDTGCGIPAEAIEKLFDPFYTTKFTGRGLGLPVVLGMVREHQGVIAVESKPGQGSRFRVFFPVAAGGLSLKTASLIPPEKSPGQGKVLVVDDEASVRNVLAKALERLGYTVLTACDGFGAVQVFRQHQEEVRCVLCDLNMPGINGWQTLAALRTIKPNTPVILMSGYNETQVLVGQHAEQPQAFLGKPCNYDELWEKLERVLNPAEKDSR